MKLWNRKNKEIKFLYKEEKTMEREYRKKDKNYRSEILENKKNKTNEYSFSDYYVDVEPNNKIHNLNTSESDFNENISQTNLLNHQDTSTLLITISSKEYRNIKRKNNHKRKNDDRKDLKNTANNIIELKNVSKDYLASGKQISKILINLNLTIKKGDFVVLFGKSGSGKSTLLNIISGLDRPTEGDVVVSNTNLPYLSNSQLTTFRRKHISFIFQQYHLLNNITGYENVETGAFLQKDKSNKIDIHEMFKEFDLEDVMYKYPPQMSGGQQQRVSILRALAKNSDIIFADEPTGALDKKTSDIVMNLLKKINEEQHKTIIMVSHDPEIVKYAKRKIFLNKGKIISDERLR